jgi:hypothetical protein
MSRNLGWARVRPPGAATLRRGAWYPVVDDHVPNRVVLGVGTRSVAVHREFIQLRQHLPAGFSVVMKTPVDPNPVAGTGEDVGLTYAVCPWSRSRVRLKGHPDHLECPDCGHRGLVDWEESC